MKHLALLIFLFTFGCKEEPRANVTLPPRPAVPLTTVVPEPQAPTPQLKVVVPPVTRGEFDSRLQHIQEQVQWVNKRLP